MTLAVDIAARLGDLDLAVQMQAPPGVTVLFGPSGAGKSSVIKAIAGLIRPDSGRIALGARVLSDGRAWVPPHKRRIGYVFQEARLFPHLSVRRNLTYGGTHDFDRLVAVLGLGALLDRRPAGLSGGERQRVALGRALMTNPDLILMDEPLAALDGPRKAEVMPYIAALGAGAGVPVVYVTHAMSEVTQLADHLVILDQGKVVQAGTLDAVLADPASARFFGKRDSGAILRCTVGRHEAGITVLTSAAGEILLPGQVGAVGDALRLRIPAQDVILSRQPLEGQSALNMLRADITAITPLPGGTRALMLRAGTAHVWAELTPLSVERLALAPGQSVHAVFKATAVGAG